MNPAIREIIKEFKESDSSIQTESTNNKEKYITFSIIK